MLGEEIPMLRVTGAGSLVMGLMLQGLGASAQQAGIAPREPRPSAEPTSAATSAPDLRLSLGTLSRSTLETLKAVRWSGSKREGIALKLELYDLGSTVVIAVGCRGGLVYVFEASGQVSAPLVLDDTDCEKPKNLTLTLYPAAALSGRLTVPEGASLPASARLHVAECDTGGRARRKEFGDYPVKLEKGAWTVTTPAGCLDTTLLVSSFAPVSWLGLQLAEGKPRDLGVSPLMVGASVLVRVLSGGDRLPVEGAAVAAIPEPQLEQAASAVLGGRTWPALHSGRSDARGWASLAGLPEGRFHFLCMAPGKAPSFTDVYKLRKGEQTLVEEVELLRPASLRVQVDCKRCTALKTIRVTVSGCPWVAGRLRPYCPLSSEPGPDGSVEFPEVTPGKWDIGLTLVRPDGLGQRLVSRTVEVLPGTAETLKLEFGGLLIEGEITLRGKPVQADLDLRPQFKGWHGAPNAKSDALGKFTLLIERPGLYTGYVRSRTERLDTTVPDVRLDDSVGSVKVRVPEGRIDGTAVDEQGTPLPDAHISAQQLRREKAEDSAGERVTALLSATLAAADGTFVLDGLSPGPWEVRGNTEAASGGPLSVTLDGERTVEGVRLVLNETVKLAGRILNGAGQPLMAELQIAAVSTESFRGAQSDRDGRFEVALSRKDAAGPVNIQVAAPGEPMAAFQLPVSRDVELHLPPVGGTVRIRGAKEGGRTWTRLALINQEGAIASVAFWSVFGAVVPPSSSGDPLVISSLAPGSWRLVAMESLEVWRALVHGQGRNVPTLAVFDVVPGGSVEVTLPVQAPAK
jgi:hypothetical protein